MCCRLIALQQFYSLTEYLRGKSGVFTYFFADAVQKPFNGKKPGYNKTWNIRKPDTGNPIT